MVVVCSSAHTIRQALQATRQLLPNSIQRLQAVNQPYRGILQPTHTHKVAVDPQEKLFRIKAASISK